ncbi:MAG: hypothetical protein OXH86_01400 [Acidimicrobiaceae bacterium]|nr:hypothetical protein [Acidimicrobiaceae bacterium]
MLSPRMRDWLKSNVQLLLTLVGIGLTIWSILQPSNPQRAIPIISVRFGYPEYVSAAVVFALATALLVFASSRRFWPRVKFSALLDLIEDCRDDVGKISQALDPNLPFLASAVDLREFNDLMHNMDRLRARLHRLGINLPEAQLGSDGADQMHEHLRHLAVLADVGDHRRARDMWRPEEP